MLLALLCLLPLASSARILGGPKCTWGPSYWCANLPQASECSAVKHCVKAVWEKETVPQDDDEVCTICKEMVGEARDTLMSNETQEELKEVFDGSCDLIPIKLVAKECRALFDEFVPELVETLGSEMNPDTVCTVSGLCNSARIDKMLEEHRALRHQGGDCLLCREGAGLTARQLKTESLDQVEDRLLQLCGYFGSFADACRVGVLDKAQELYQFLTTQPWDEGVCDLSGMCSQAFDTVPSTPVPEVKEDIQCEFCEKVIRHWVDTYASNASLAEFKQLMDGICDKLDKKNAEHCKHVVDDYYMPAFEFLKKEIDPHMICNLVGLCPAELSNMIFRAQPQVALLPALQLASSSVPLASSSSCDLCESVLETVFSGLEDPYNQRMVKNALETVCYTLPSSIEARCEQFVESYTATILDFITAGIEPNQLCLALDLCSGQNTFMEQQLEELERQEVEEVPVFLKMKDNTCVLCEYVVTTLDGMITDQANEEEIKQALESLCSYLPKSLSSQCNTFVDTYTDIIIDMLTKDVKPEMICSNLGLCSNLVEQQLEQLEKQVEIVKDNTCVLCEYVVTTLDGMITDKTNEEEVKEALETLCSYLPTSVTKQCDNFVETYTDIIIDMLTKDVTPKMICTNLGLCDNTKIRPPQFVDVETVRIGGPHKVGGGYCTLCDIVVGNLEQQIQDKSNEEEIKQALDVLCYGLSAPVHKECIKLVSQYTEDIIDMMTQDYPAHMICSEIGLCVDNEITSNDIPQVHFKMIKVDTRNSVTSEVLCEMCEFAVKVIDERLGDAATVDQIEREVQFVCSYLPGTIADKCEQMVDRYGEQLIEALIKKEMDPKMVCAGLVPDCTDTTMRTSQCVWGPEMWCASPFHAKICGATAQCGF